MTFQALPDLDARTLLGSLEDCSFWSQLSFLCLWSKNTSPVSGNPAFQAAHSFLQTHNHPQVRKWIHWAKPEWPLGSDAATRSTPPWKFTSYFGIIISTRWQRQGGRVNNRCYCLGGSSQNVPQWHTDYSELQLLRKRLMQEGRSDPPFCFPESRK